MKLYSTVCIGLLIIFVCPDPKQPEVVSDFCGNYKLIRPTSNEIDTLSRQTVNEILANNEKYKRLCIKKK